MFKLLNSQIFNLNIIIKAQLRLLCMIPQSREMPRKRPKKGNFTRFNTLGSCEREREREPPDRVDHLVALLLLIRAASRSISERLAERNQRLSSNFYSLRFSERSPGVMQREKMKIPLGTRRCLTQKRPPDLPFFESFPLRMIRYYAVSIK